MKRFSRSPSAVRGRYPLATVAAYGPDTTLATKLVVSVIERPGQRDPTAMRSWMTEAVDVRRDPVIAVEVAVSYGIMMQGRPSAMTASLAVRTRRGLTTRWVGRARAARSGRASTVSRTNR
jgi:hypothetical protein